MNLDDLKEINDYDKVKQFIKIALLTNEQLFRLIFFANKNPFDEINYPMPENPYAIFEENDSSDNPHGVVLFDRKNDSILNSEIVNLLIDMESLPMGSYREYSSNRIIIRVIEKGSSIRTLENGVERFYAIFKLLDDELNKANINGLGLLERTHISEMSLNNENSGLMCIYKYSSFSYDFSSNKNIQNRIFGGDDY